MWKKLQVSYILRMNRLNHLVKPLVKSVEHFPERPPEADLSDIAQTSVIRLYLIFSMPQFYNNTVHIRRFISSPACRP